MNNEVVIKLDNISKSFKNGLLKTEVLHSISFEVALGEFVFIQGPSGSGKTTLLNILGLMDKPTKGKYYLENVDISKNERDHAALRSKYFGFVFQHFYLANELNVLENVSMPMGYAGIGLTERRKRSKELLFEVGLSGFEKKYPNQLSGGEKQRVSIARALANSPQVLFADEPTGNLDSVNSSNIMNLFKDLNRKGLTVVMITHDKSLLKYGTRTITVTDGSIVEDYHANQKGLYS